MDFRIIIIGIFFIGIIITYIYSSIRLIYSIIQKKKLGKMKYVIRTNNRECYIEIIFSLFFLIPILFKYIDLQMKLNSLKEVAPTNAAFFDKTDYTNLQLTLFVGSILLFYTIIYNVIKSYEVIEVMENGIFSYYGLIYYDEIINVTIKKNVLYITLNKKMKLLNKRRYLFKDGQDYQIEKLKTEKQYIGEQMKLGLNE